MPVSSRTLHLTLASSAALALIVSAYVLSGPFSFRPTSAEAATAEELLKSYASKDSDSDGLPDWEEALYGTDPANPQSFKVGIKDGDAVAQGLVKPKVTSAPLPSDQGKSSSASESDVADNTITAQFSRNFFSEYLSAYGWGATLTDVQLASFTEKAVTKLVAAHPFVPKYSVSAVRVSGSGAAALKTYASQAEKAFAKNTIPSTKNELDYMDDAITRNDASGLVQVQKIGAAYTAIAKAYLQVPVPSEARVAHLKVVNAMVRLGEVITDMGTASTDPLRSLLGLTLYPESAGRLLDAFSELNAVFVADGVMLAEGQPGYSIYKLGLAPTPTQ